MRTRWLFVVLALVGAAAVHSETWVWVDENGVTHLTNDPKKAPEGSHGRQALDTVWDGPLAAPGPVASVGSVGRDEARMRRLLQGAVADLERGENARAGVVLRDVLRREPGRPEAHWYLAKLDRHRGRYDAAESHLQSFLASAGEELAPWRTAAEQRLRELADERRLADEAIAHRDDWIEGTSENFRIHYDSELASLSSDYASKVMRFLEDARTTVGRQLGTLPMEPMGVVFYGRANYNRAHRHRFSFQTVGFFDGRIHVVSAGHPAEELRALLFHEYVHAVYRERTGGDRPYWLNEGLAELSERASRGQQRLSRSERSLLRRRMDADAWIRLRRIAPSFSGLDDGDARAAYLEATAAAAWIEDRTDRAQRALILTRLGAGRSADEAFDEVLGLDTDGVDAGVRDWIRSEFPLTAQPAAGLP
jgi:hypothetical protein